MADLIQLRRGTATDWAAIDPVLAQGEFAVTLDSLDSDPKFKIGDGIKKWSELPYIGVAGETPEHNQLDGLQGGATGEYYHLTQTELTDLGTAISDSHTHANKTLLDSITDEGAGNEFLSDDGTYKAAGLAYFEESRSVAAPNATVPAHQIIAKGEETNIDLVLSPKGTGAILAQIPNNLVSGGNKRGERAVDFQMSRELVPSSNKDMVAAGQESGILSGGNNKISSGGYRSVITGGAGNTIETDRSVIGGGGVNVISSGRYCVIGGGIYNEISLPVNDLGASILGGIDTKARFYGQQAHASGSLNDVTGDAQRSDYVMRGNTRDVDNNYRLYLNGSSLSIIPANIGNYVCMQCKLKITGFNKDTSEIDYFGYEGIFTLYRENTTPVVTALTAIYAWQKNASDVGVGVDIDSSGYLRIYCYTTVDNWQFVAHLETVETFTATLA